MHAINCNHCSKLYTHTYTPNFLENESLDLLWVLATTSWIISKKKKIKFREKMTFTLRDNNEYDVIKKAAIKFLMNSFDFDFFFSWKLKIEFARVFGTTTFTCIFAFFVRCVRNVFTHMFLWLLISRKIWENTNAKVFVC